jgi:hypothetical protein
MKMESMMRSMPREKEKQKAKESPGLPPPSNVIGGATIDLATGRKRMVSLSVQKDGKSERVPMTIEGRSKISLRIEKLNVAGTGAPSGLSRTQCEYTDCVVFSNACEAKLSQYSTTDWFSKS